MLLQIFPVDCFVILYDSLYKDLPADKVISINSGYVMDVEGFVGEYIAIQKDAYLCIYYWMKY